MHRNETIVHASALKVFGEEFDKYSGLRPLILATGMHDGTPIDDLNHGLEVLYRRLSNESVLQGIEKEEDLYALICACLDLRIQYGHGVWVQGALLDYMRFVKNLPYRDAVEYCSSEYKRALQLAGESMLRHLLVEIDY